MEEKRCYGCMKMKSEESVCEHCGYDENIQNETHQLTAGTILKEQYLIGKVLGQGGFGITYLGWDMYLDIPVAIKEYFPNQTVMRDVAVSTDVVSYSGDAGVRFRNNKERFMREAKMLARFSQVPEIVQVRNFFLANNTAYIVMEYVEGITLKQLVKEHGGVLPKEMTFEIIKPIIEALCKVHKAGLVHRDISPDNIMMLPNGKAKLLDFGAVRDVGGADVNSPLSQSTEAILKQGYAPIEQYQNRGSLGPWTDVYALCATIYYCLTGNVPTDAPGRLLDDEEISFEGLGLSEQEMGALQKGMALRANDRVRSMDELLQLLENSKEKEEQKSTANFEQMPEEPAEKEPVLSEKEKKANMKNLVIAVLVIVAVVLIFVIGQELIKISDSAMENTSAEETAEEFVEDIYQGQCGETVYFTFDPESNVLHITGTGDMYDYNGTWQENSDDPQVTPPESDRELPPWTDYKMEIYSVYIEDGITGIGDNAFESCDNLEDVRFGKGVKSIGWQAFLSTGIHEAVLPEGLEIMDDCAFNFCENLEKVVLPESLIALEGWEFNECPSLSAVIVGDNTEITENSFHCEDHEDRSCLNDLVLYVTPGSKAEETAANSGYTCKEKAAGWCGPTVAWYIDLDEKCLYLLGWGGTGVYNIGEDEDAVEQWVAEGYSEEWISREFPDWFSKYSNKIEKIKVGPYIGELNHRVFNNLIYLKEVDLGAVQNVCAILDSCASLEEVNIPETVQTIEWDTFAYCENLRKVTIFGENVRLDRGVFRDTPNLEEVYFSKGAVIDDTYGDLFDTNLGSEVSPNVTFYVYAGSDAERYAKKYDIPYEIREEDLIDENSEYPTGQCGDDIRWTLNTDNHTLYLEGTGQTWLYRVEDEQRESWENNYPSEWVHSGEPDWAEQANGIYHIVIGDGITHLNYAVFQNLPHLQDVDFGNTVEFTESAFQWNMYSLEEITFPESVKVVGGYTLLWNSSLRKVVFERDDVEIHWGALAACNRLEEVYFPRNAKILDDIIDPDGNDPYSKNLTFYVYEGTDAHEKAQWYAEKYGVKIAFRED